MIMDSLDNFGKYFQGLEHLEEMLRGLGEDHPEGRHEIEGDEIFALVSRYETRAREACRPEAHRQFVDVQLLLRGREVIEWHPVGLLKEAVPYDATADVAFYRMPERQGTSLALEPGVFAVFFPEDAHAPQMHYGGPEGVVKVVIKIAAHLL